MNLQHVGQHESLSAIMTDVRPLPVVRLAMDAHVPRSGEPFLTHLTRVPLLVGVGRCL